MFRRALTERIAIAGSGAIASGLAAVAAQVGDVLVLARSDASAERARGAIERACQKVEATGGVHVTTTAAELSGATFLVEAVAEDPAAKAGVLGTLAAVSGPDAIIATTTSSLSVGDLAVATGAPERFVGLHVFNPVPKMRLVELAFPTRATQDTRARALALCEALGKEAVVVPDMAGFVVNRLLFPYLFSAIELLEQTGMPAEDVDRCMTLGAGHPIGPLALLDFVGLDVAEAIGREIGRPAPPRLRELVGEGALGRKSGRGFFTYA